MTNPQPSSIEHMVCFGSMFITDENIIKALCGGGDSAQLTSAVNGALDGVNSLLSKIPGLSEKALPTGLKTSNFLSFSGRKSKPLNTFKTRTINTYK